MPICLGLYIIQLLSFEVSVSSVPFTDFKVDSRLENLKCELFDILSCFQQNSDFKTLKSVNGFK